MCIIILALNKNNQQCDHFEKEKLVTYVERAKISAVNRPECFV